MLKVTLHGSLLFLSFAPAVFGQASPQARTPDPQLALANVAYEPLGSGDLVYVSVADCPEANRSYRVSANGDLKLALLSQPIHAEGLVPGDLEKQITQAMADAHILV